MPGSEGTLVGDHRGDRRARAAAEGAACSRSATSSRWPPRSPRPTPRSRSQPAAVELIDRTILELSRSKLEYRRLADTLEGDPGRCCSSPSSADTPDEARAQLDTLEVGRHAYHTLVAETAAEQEALTKVRKAGLGLLMAASEGARRPLAFVEDTAVAPERLGDVRRALQGDPRRATG